MANCDVYFYNLLPNHILVDSQTNLKKEIELCPMPKVFYFLYIYFKSDKTPSVAMIPAAF